MVGESSDLHMGAVACMHAYTGTSCIHTILNKIVFKGKKGEAYEGPREGERDATWG